MTDALRIDALVAEAERMLERGRRGAAELGGLVDELALDIDAVLGDSPALVIAKAANRKLAPVDLVDVGGPRKRPVPRRPFVSASYLPVRQTCPDGCTFRDAGCYAQTGYTGRAIRRLEAAAEGLSRRRIARAEARAIDSLCARGVPRDGGRDGRGPRDLRLHVSGDVAELDALEPIVEAVERWRARGGGSAWSFTHAWRRLPRAAWGPISILASVEAAHEGDVARERGYVPALTVRRFPSRSAFRLRGSATTWIPCPAEAGKRTCVQCRLCLDRTNQLRASGKGIAFAVHGLGAAEAKRRLPVVRTEAA